MNITIVRESFLEILQRAGYFISNRISDLKIFKGVLIHAEQDGIIIRTTNINEHFSGEIGGKVLKTGEVLVDYKTLFEIVKNLNDIKIQLEKKDNTLIISSKSGLIKLAILDAVNFPAPEQKNKTLPLSLSLFEDKIINLALLSCALDEARPILTGVCFDFLEKETKIVGTDGFRMSLNQIGQTNPEIRGQKLIVSAKSLNALLRVFKGSLKQINFSLSEKKAYFTGNGTSVSTRLLEGEFPPYNKVVPQSFETAIGFKKTDLSEVVKSSSLFAKEGSNMITFTIKKDQLTVSSSGVGVGEAVFNVPLDSFEGKENKIVFNYRYLLDYLNSVDTTDIIFEMSNPFAPGVFKAKKSPRALHIIMPIRSQE